MAAASSIADRTATVDDTSAPSVENPNRDSIDGLRAAAEWLEVRPWLPRVSAHLSVHTFGVSDAKEIRSILGRVAAAIGPDVTEEVDQRGNLLIDGPAGTPHVQVHAVAQVAKLGGRPVGFDYRPIVGVCGVCHGSGVAASRAADESQGECPNPRCEAGKILPQPGKDEDWISDVFAEASGTYAGTLDDNGNPVF